MKTPSLRFNGNPARGCRASFVRGIRPMSVFRRIGALGGVCILLSLLLPTCLAAQRETSPGVSPGKATDARERSRNRKKDLATLRVHLEINRDRTDRNLEISVLRNHPLILNVEREPFLWETYLSESKVIPIEGGGVEMELQFNSQGRTLLENYSAANRGRRIAIEATFEKTHRWLAAPKMARLISNGVLRFTPDASLEEAERIVLGLNNVAKVKRKKDKF